MTLLRKGQIPSHISWR